MIELQNNDVVFPTINARMFGQVVDYELLSQLPRYQLGVA